MARRVLGALLVAFAATASLDARGDDAQGDATARTETTLIPLVGGNSDFGWGAGVLGAIARVSPRYKPYLWRIELASMTTFKSQPSGLAVPFQDDYVTLTIPELVPRTLRLEMRPSFTREGTLKYAGLGNASPQASDERRYEYSRTHPTLAARAELSLGKHRSPASTWRLLVGISDTLNRFDIPSDTVLARDAKYGSPTVRSLLVGMGPHEVLLFEYGILFDTRDDEISPRFGQWHQLKFRLSPGGSGEFTQRYAQGNLTLRGYFSPIRNRLTVALRLVGDMAVGEVPFYELPRYENTYAIGGGEGVRGIPAQRYYGRVKIFGNIETRTYLLQFRFLKKPIRLILANFLDLGRVWSELPGHTELDGTGLGLHYGIGGGIRLRVGQAFVIRADLGWAPQDQQISAYFQAGHIF